MASKLKRETAEELELTNGIMIEVATANYRTIRGRTIVAALLDEAAFYPTDDSVSPDFEVVTAVKPAMATVPGVMLLVASSPYARRGILWNVPPLLWKG